MSCKIPEKELLVLPSCESKKSKIYMLNHLEKTNLSAKNVNTI